MGDKVGPFAAATLIEGGNTPEHALLVDQFYWSAHVEMVGVFQNV